MFTLATVVVMATTIVSIIQVKLTSAISVSNSAATLCHRQITKQTAPIHFPNSKKPPLSEISSRIKVGGLTVRMVKPLPNISTSNLIFHSLPITTTVPIMAMPFHHQIKKITITTSVFHRAKEMDN